MVMKKNNKALYESIMHKVSRVVKQALNEDVDVEDRDGLYDALISLEEFSEVEVEDLVKSYGAEYDEGDIKYDDGIDDDDEDEYVMCCSFYVRFKNQDYWYVRIYYGNNSYKVGYVDINDRP